MTELAAAIRDIPLPERMRKLPISAKGFPVPWFVAWMGEGDRETRPGQGTPDFRVVGSNRTFRAVRDRLCWLCGEPMGKFQTLAIGPMCAINRTTSEPGSHLDCATYAMLACPFLANPRMRRNEHEMIPERIDAPGLHLPHNPGAMALWTTCHLQPFHAGIGQAGILFRFPEEPHAVSWWAEGRTATRAEVDRAIAMGLPKLRAVAEAHGEAADLERFIKAADRFLPSVTP